MSNEDRMDEFDLAVDRFSAAQSAMKQAADEAQAARQYLHDLHAFALEVASTPPGAQSTLVVGRCPACDLSMLFVGTGGYITCANADCPEPDAVSNLITKKEEK